MQHKEFVISLKSEYKTTNHVIAFDEVCNVWDMDTHSFIKTGIQLETGKIRVLRVIDAVALINQKFPDHEIKITGNESCVIAHDKTVSPVWAFIKTILLSIILFFGGAIGIISFNEDVEMKMVHNKINTILTGKTQENAPLLSVPYSIGILAGFIGILGIFGKKEGKRPGLLELDIDEYEDKVKKYFTGKKK